MLMETEVESQRRRVVFYHKAEINCINKFSSPVIAMVVEEIFSESSMHDSHLTIIR